MEKRVVLVHLAAIGLDIDTLFHIQILTKDI